MAEQQIQAEDPKVSVGSLPAVSAGIEMLCQLARLHHIPAEPQAVQHQLGLGESEAITSRHLLLAAKSLDLKAKLSRSTAGRLTLTPLPALASMTDGRWVLLAQCDGDRVLVLDPAKEGGLRPLIEPQHVFVAEWCYDRRWPRSAAA